MARTGGEIVVRALEDEGVPFAFGIPGTHNIELYDALASSASVRTVLVTDEQSASFMADGVWRSTGRIACVNVVPGAGLTHALSGVAEAFLDNVGMLVLGCGIRRDTGMAFQLHDVDQAAIVRPVTKAGFRPEQGEQLYATIRRACQLARTAPAGPVFVEVPANLYLFRHGFDASVAADPLWVDDPASVPASAAEPAESDIEAAAEALGAATRPLLYLGLGAAGAGTALIELAERLEAPVATTFQGKGIVPESHPLFLWPGFGPAAPPFARSVAASCDATLAIGCRFSEVATGSYGAVPPGRLVHVDIDRRVVGRNYPANPGVVADAAAFVRALLPRIAQRKSTDGALRSALRQGHEKVRREWHDANPERGVTPARLLEALQQRFGAETVFTTDSGNGTFLAVECLRLDRPGHLLSPVDYSCMGYAVPAAIGAQLATPQRTVVALAGDGAFLMTGLELLTAASEGATLAVFVLRDRELAQIAQFQQIAMNRKTASILPDFDVTRLCGALGVECVSLDTNAGIPDVLERVASVVAEGRPSVVDVSIDYSDRTYFTRGVVRTNLARFPLRDRMRLVGRALGRRLIR